MPGRLIVAFSLGLTGHLAIASCSIGVAPGEGSDPGQDIGADNDVGQNDDSAVSATSDDQGVDSSAANESDDMSMESGETPQDEGQAEHCLDDMLSGDETDIDCGGDDCDGCGTDKMCVVDRDCLSGRCDRGICLAVNCREDIDCSGLDEACRIGHCDRDTASCVVEDRDDTTACDTDDFCRVDGQCLSGQCEGQPRDCSDLDSACTLGVCDSGQSTCTAEAISEGETCNDADPCTHNDRCSAGECRGQSVPAIFSEDFSSPDPGWQMLVTPAGTASSWSIAAAKGSFGCQIGQDPSSDASADDTNALAGVVVGGCAPSTTSENWDCLVSPAVDLTGIALVDLEFSRYLGSDLIDPGSGAGVYNRIEAQIADEWRLVEEGYNNFIVDEAWVPQQFQIDPQNESEFRVRICYSNRQLAGAANFSGWSVDDFELINPACRR